MTGHVPETVGHDAENTGHALPKYALGRSNWLFAGSVRAGKRAAPVMSLFHSVRIDGLDSFAHLWEVLQLLPTYPANRIDD